MSSLPVPVAPVSPAALDPFVGASTSRANRAGRLLWGVVWTLLFRTSPRPAHAWRAALLRLFGAKLGPHCHVYPQARIWAPWNLLCEDHVGIADEAVIYNPAPIRLRSHAVISQQAYLCGAGHDIDHPSFPMVSRPIEIGRRAWVAARASVCAGVRLGDGAVLGLGSVATRDIPDWAVHAGVPARLVRMRRKTDDD